MSTKDLNVQYQSYSQIGLGGLSTYNDAQNIADTELADMRNLNMDSGAMGPRLGSLLWAAKPTGETNKPLQIFTPKTSDGYEYMIVIYGNNFYLRDIGPSNATNYTAQWVKLNTTYTPTLLNAFYGNLSWCSGLGTDAHYFCNGTDSMMKWPIVVDYNQTQINPTDTTITVSKGVQFPASGTLIIMNNGTRLTASYIAVSGNTITLSSALGTTVPSGSLITVPLQQMTGMKIGKVLARFQRRLFIGGITNANSTFWYSTQDTPEDYTTGSTITNAGFVTVADGTGPILDMSDFGQFLLIDKGDSFHQFSFIYNSSLNAKLDQVLPYISGRGMGPISNAVTIKDQNNLYYPTETEGIFKLSPASTGSTSSSSGVTVISPRITDLVRDSLSFDNSRVAGYNQKIYWLCSTLFVGVADPTTLVNDIVLVYDITRDIFYTYDNWNAVDIKPYRNELYFVSGDDGAVYVAENDYQDTRSGGTIAYTAYGITKRFDHGAPADPKNTETIFVQGYIDPATTLYVDVLYNEGGSLGKQTFKISGNGSYAIQPPLSAMGIDALGIPELGGADTAFNSSTVGFFRCYLSTSSAYQYHNIQLKFYSTVAGSNWNVTFIAFDPIRSDIVPSELIISPQ